MKFSRGFTLVEVVVVVVLLAIAVPPTVLWMNDASATRADAVNATRATMLATVVLETIEADVASPAPSLGFAALANSNAYLNTGTTGLRARIATWSTPYEALGMSYTVTISGLVGPSGAATGNATVDVFRTILVRVTAPSAQASAMTMDFTTMVADL